MDEGSVGVDVVGSDDVGMFEGWAGSEVVWIVSVKGWSSSSAVVWTV